MRASFVLLAEHRTAFDGLSDEDAGKLIKAVFRYHVDGEVPDLPPMPNFAFQVLKPVFDRFNERYEDTCRKRREAGAKGGKAKASNAKQNEANLANASNCQQELANDSKAKQTLANSSDRDRDRDRVPDPDREEIKDYTHDGSHDLFAPETPARGVCVSGPVYYSQEDVFEASDNVKREAEAVRQEFDQLRDAYKPVRDDGPNAGWAEYQQARRSKGWPGLLFVLDRLQTLIEQDAQWRRGYKEGLRRFLTDRMWEMEPRKDAGQEPELTPEQEEAKRKVAEGRRRYEEKMAKLKEQKRKLGYG